LKQVKDDPRPRARKPDGGGDFYIVNPSYLTHSHLSLLLTPYNQISRMHAVILGASKGCGYHALVRILAIPEWTATILLRKPELIESDNHLKKYLADGR